MNIMKRVRDTINSLTNEITDEAFFTGREFKEFIMASLKTALGELARRTVSLEITYDETNSFTACTDGEVILANAGNKLVHKGETLKDRYLLFLGMLIHEVGHRLFTDFPAAKLRKEKWENLYPDPIEDPRWELMLEELKMFPNLKQYFLHTFCNADNIIEDGYIEQKIFGLFSGMFAYGLHTFNRTMFSEGKTVSDWFDEVLSEEDRDQRDSKFVSFLMAQTLRVVKEYPERTGRIDTPEKMKLYRRYSSFMANAEGILQDLMYEDDPERRSMLLNEYMLNLYDYFPGKQDEENEEPEDGESSLKACGSSSGSKSERTSDLSEELADLKEMPAGSIAPKGTTHSVALPVTDEESSEEQKEQSKELSETDAAERGFESDFESVVKKMAEAKVEDEHKKELQEEASEIHGSVAKPLSSLSSGRWKYTIARPSSHEVMEEDKERYLFISKGMRKYSEPAIRKMNAVLTKRAESGSSKGYQYGRFDPTQYSRAALAGDGRTFRQNRLPNGRPSVAFAILIDESGSMYGEKALAARDTAIVLSDILCGVKVPHMIAGHTTSSDYDDNDCMMKLYHDFDEVDGMDKYRLGGIEASRENRDGAAIAYMSEKLLKRPEADKILIVISDGWPSHSGFFNSVPVEDTKETLQRYRRKGIHIIGAVIDCYRDIEQIYGRMNCLDLMDLSKLPMTLSSLVKRYILN